MTVLAEKMTVRAEHIAGKRKVLYDRLHKRHVVLQTPKWYRARILLRIREGKSI